MGLAPYIAQLPPLAPKAQRPNYYRRELSRLDRRRAQTLGALAADLSATRDRIQRELALLEAGRRGPR
jgi:hypothetical protein